MGQHDSREVYDIEADTMPMSPADQVAAVVGKIMDADRWFAEAAGYALARMYYEASPVEPDPETLGEDTPETPAREWEDAARYGFAYAYQQMMIGFRDRERAHVVPLPQAWENYTRTRGGSIDPIEVD